MKSSGTPSPCCGPMSEESAATWSLKPADGSTTGNGVPISVGCGRIDARSHAAKPDMSWPVAILGVVITLLVSGVVRNRRVGSMPRCDDPTARRWETLA